MALRKVEVSVFYYLIGSITETANYCLFGSWVYHLINPQSSFKLRQNVFQHRKLDCCILLIFHTSLCAVRYFLPFVDETVEPIDSKVSTKGKIQSIDSFLCFWKLNEEWTEHNKRPSIALLFRLGFDHFGLILCAAVFPSTNSQWPKMRH